MLLIFSTTTFLSACGSSIYQSADEMKAAFDNTIYTCYDDGVVKAQLSFSDGKVTHHIFYEYIGDTENTYDIENWKYNSDVIILDFLDYKINVKDINTIEYDDDIYELGDIAEEYLIGNPFLDAPDTDSVDNGGGLIRIISLSKEEVSNASQDEYKEFIDQRVSKMNKNYEMFIVCFDDGTGIIYYGCDPSNNMYGKLSYHAIIEPYGYIIKENNGMYTYYEFDD